MGEAVDGLENAWRRLARRWAESEREWDDAVRREFEKRYWQPLARESQSTAAEMERLAQALAQARRGVQ